jgi:hypothetical protein
MEKKETLMTVIIKTETHNRLKQYCFRNDLKIGPIADRAIKMYIDKKTAAKP